MSQQLDQTTWDCCVIGNGASALWVSHWLWSSKKSVLWITSDEPFAPERAMLQKAWLWGAKSQSASHLTSTLQGFDFEDKLDDFELTYFDAKSTKTFKKLSDLKLEWGKHEKGFFERLMHEDEEKVERKDLWPWHRRLYDFHGSGMSSNGGPSQIELFKEPRFVRVQGWPVYELKTEDGKIVGVNLSNLNPRSKKSIQVKADRFYLGDFHEPLHNLIQSEIDGKALAAVAKSMSFRAGFGLQLWHDDLPNVLSQVVVVPLTVNPSSKKGHSHVIGRFMKVDGKLQSYWIGFLDDVEVEDNNEILKKIKQTKRAIDRAIPGFSKSIQRESVSFEPKMYSGAKIPKKKTTALGAVVFSDSYGPQGAINQLEEVFGE